jgi:hypothetical protein
VTRLKYLKCKAREAVRRVTILKYVFLELGGIRISSREGYTIVHIFAVTTTACKTDMRDY